MVNLSAAIVGSSDFVTAAMVRRCKGKTRLSKQCSITETCTLTNDAGRCVGEPLKRGGDHCLFHAKPFCTEPVEVDAKSLVVVLLDLETTGTDIGCARILELAAVHAQRDARFVGGGFSALVQVEPAILETDVSRRAEAVHGISPQEVAALGLDFEAVWGAFLAWTDHLVNDFVGTPSSSSDSDAEDAEDVARLPQAGEARLLLVGHNSFAFDFPFLIVALLRHRLSLAPMERFLFADTLTIFKAMECSGHGCLKLQCMVRAFGRPGDLRAHRGYDDTLALLQVATTLAQRLDLSLLQLLSRFASTLDVQATCAALSVLMED